MIFHRFFHGFFAWIYAAGLGAAIRRTGRTQKVLLPALKQMEGTTTLQLANCLPTIVSKLAEVPWAGSDLLIWLQNLGTTLFSHGNFQHIWVLGLKIRVPRNLNFFVNHLINLMVDHRFCGFSLFFPNEMGTNSGLPGSLLFRLLWKCAPRFERLQVRSELGVPIFPKNIPYLMGSRLELRIEFPQASAINGHRWNIFHCYVCLPVNLDFSTRTSHRQRDGNWIGGTLPTFSRW